MKDLDVVTVKSGRGKRGKKKDANIPAILKFLNQQINKLPGTILVAGGVGFFEYAHAELKGVIGCIDFKVIMYIALLCILLGAKACIHEVKETMKLKQEITQLRIENRKLRGK